jgi:protease-4
MDQNNPGQPPQQQSPPPPMPPRPPIPQRGMYPPPPVPVQVINKSGGFFRSLAAAITALFVLGVVFLIGLLIGVPMGMFGGMGAEEPVFTARWRDGNGGMVAIIPVEGVIDDVNANFVRNAVRDVMKHRAYDAIVLRVDSPGGGVTASDQIWREVKRLQDSGLPVIASYGSSATSGGYYVSCHADQIFAEETCITGSIGVIAQVLTMEDLMDKVGIEPVTIVASGSPDKDVANNPYRTWNERDREKVGIMIDAAYDIFRRRVEDGRAGKVTGGFDAVADGDIFTAQQALDNGLIDSIGYLDDAITAAEKAAGIRAGSTIDIYMLPPTLFGDGLLGITHQGKSDPLSADHIRSVVNDLAAPRVMYMMH